MFHHSGHFYSGGFGWIFPLFGALLFFMFMFLVFALVLRKGYWGRSRHANFTSGGQAPMGEAPMDILKKRYANGEVTKKEFDQIKKDL